MKCMWAVCNEITGKISNSDNETKIKGISEQIANNYNSYLLTVIPNLIKTLANEPLSMNIVRNNKSMYLRPTTPSEICDISQKIKNKHSSGID